ADSHAGYYEFCPAMSQLYRVVVKLPQQEEREYLNPRSWQTAGDRLIDGPRPEDGTDFSSYAAGASPVIVGYDRGRVVVAGHADHARARPDRPQCQAAMRLLRAVSRCADAAGADHAYRGGADRAGPGAACQNHRLRADLFDRERARSGSGARRQGWAEGHSGDMARQQPVQESGPDF